MLVIHYHSTTGRIGAWGSADSERSHLADHAIIRFDTDIEVDPKRHRVRNGEVVAINPNELAQWNAPTLDEVAGRIEMELKDTDQFMMPDRDIKRGPWISYRAALRALSKLPDVGAQLAAWPARPDHKDNRP